MSDANTLDIHMTVPVFFFIHILFKRNKKYAKE